MSSISASFFFADFDFFVDFDCSAFPVHFDLVPFFFAAFNVDEKRRRRKRRKNDDVECKEKLLRKQRKNDDVGKLTDIPFFILTFRGRF